MKKEFDFKNGSKEEFLGFVTRSDGLWNGQRIKKYKSQIIQYLNNYFNNKYKDDYKLMLYLLKDNKDEPPKCKNCGKYLFHYYRGVSFCSDKCSTTYLSPMLWEKRKNNSKNYEKINFSYIDDDIIINYFLTKENKIDSFKFTKDSLARVPQLLQYLDEKFKYKNNYLLMVNLVKDNLLEVPKCQTCGKDLNNYYIKSEPKYCSSKCCNSNKNKIKLTSDNYLRNHGFNWMSQNPKVKEKREQTCLEKFNAPNPLASEEIRNKIEFTNLKNLGVRLPFQSNKIQKKISETVNNKYNVNSISQLPEVKEKIKNTKSRKSSEDPNYNTGYFGSSAFLKSLQEHYGKDIVNISQTEYYQKTRFSKYYYDNLYFDSKPELAFYIYHKDKGFNIIRTPYGIRYENNKSIYFPDFEIDGQLYEIKGSHMINKDGILIDCKTGETNEHLINKTNCMKNNNVKIIIDGLEFIKYCNDKYGKKFLNQFKTNKKERNELI